MIAPGFSHLPDFSKGEGKERSGTREFQPLFGQPVEQQILIDESTIQPSEMDDDLAQLASDVDQLQAGSPVGNERDSPMDEPPLPETSYEEPAIEEPSQSHEQFERQLQELQEQHAQELAELNTRHNQDVIQHLENLQSGTFEQAADKLESILAQSLQQLFKGRLASASVEELVNQVLQSIRNGGIDTIKLTGPQHLVTAVQSALADQETLRIEVDEREQTDVVVSLNEQTLSTRIADWTRSIEKALA